MPHSSTRAARTSLPMVVFASAVFVVSATFVGCDTEPRAQAYEFTLRVLSDPDEALPGASVSRGRVALGMTDADVRVGIHETARA